MLFMPFAEDYLETIAQIGNFTKQTTGVSIIDAYFGPEDLAPQKVKTRPTTDNLMTNLDMLVDEAKQMDDELRRTAIASDLESLKVVVRWLSGEDISYTRLVEGIFGITPCKFSQSGIRRAQQAVEDSCTGLSGSKVLEKVLKWEEENKISGETLKRTINTDVREHTREIERLFEKQVFAHLPPDVQNKGVTYKTVKGEPWGAYNYYQGDYTSVNVVNIDRPFNKHVLIGTLSHEYEHHVANIFSEKYYHENRALDLAAVLLHTKRCIIGEGTANCARDFLDLRLGGENSKLVESLSFLRDMTSLNVAYMLNVEKAEDETAIEYFASEGFVPMERARKGTLFSRPLTPNGKPNFWRPYAYTYFFGRRDYVLPTFKKAKRKDKLKEFFRTLYLNPYSRSTATWKTAFSKVIR
jgi:hypothetical protein